LQDIHAVSLQLGLGLELLTEDALAAGAVWFSLKYPLLMLALLTVLAALMIWLLPKLWRGVMRVLSAARQLLGSRV
jgi:hypothetical protein